MAIHKLGRSENKLHTLPDGAHGDGNNLWLLVRNGGGSKTWIFRWKNRFKDAPGFKQPAHRNLRVSEGVKNLLR